MDREGPDAMRMRGVADYVSPQLRQKKGFPVTGQNVATTVGHQSSSNSRLAARLPQAEESSFIASASCQRYVHRGAHGKLSERFSQRLRRFEDFGPRSIWKIHACRGERRGVWGRVAPIKSVRPPTGILVRV